MGLGITGLVVLLMLVDVDAVAAALRGAAFYYMIPAIGLMLLATAAKARRWMIALRQLEIFTPYPRLVGTYLIGVFYSQFLPGSSAGGDTMRIAESAVESGRPVDSALAVIVERVVGLVSIFVAASFILVFIKSPGLPLEMELMLHLISIGLVIGLFMLYRGWGIRRVEIILTRFHMPGLSEKIADVSNALRNGLGQPRVLGQMVVFSWLANMFSLTAFYLVTLAVTEPLPYFTFIAMFTLVVTVEGIPLTPGALGVREGAYVFFLKYLDVGKNHALSVALLVLTLNWFLAVCGGLVSMHRSLWEMPEQPFAGVEENILVTPCPPARDG